ncbi:MAG: DUF1501 domain-containing protein [Blastocatellia bacterium]
MPNTTRRDFIKTGAVAGTGLALPIVNRQAMGTTVVEMLRDDLVADGRILVVVELAGGNDPLNTIVPLQQYDTYASFRSRIAIAKDQVLPLYGSTTMGLSPNLSALKPLADAGKMAVVQMCHYPTPNLSHDGSRSVYRQGDASGSVANGGTGWIGRHSVLFGNKTNSLDTVGIGGVNSTLYAPGAKISGILNDAQGNASGYLFRTDDRYTADRNNQLVAARVNDSAISDKPYIELSEATQIDALNSADLVAQATGSYQSTVTYPTNNLAPGLKLIAKLATSTAPLLGTRVFYIGQGGYDTHADQLNDQQTLHRTLAESLKAFYDDLVAHNLGDKVLILIWSEFGRRVADNASIGTDHGEANNMYLIGNRVIGGVYGADPKLNDLQNGNLKRNFDFRDVYSTVIQNWFGNSASDAQKILNGSFANLGFLM